VTRNEPPRAAEGPTADLSQKRRADDREGTRDIARDERRFETHDAVPGAFERCVSPRVSTPTFDVVRAIDLDHETLRGSKEIRDEAPEQRDLPAKDDA
jgi:hypothetical protein